MGRGGSPPGGEAGERRDQGDCELRIVALDASNEPAWEELFDASGSACFCRYWHFAGKKNDWLARCFHDPDANRREQAALVHSGAPEARGLLALEGPLAVGWMKLAPRALLPKIVQQGAYRSLDLGPGEGVWSIGCFLVRPGRRRQGVARALVTAAPDHVRAWATADRPARAVEAYPRGSPPPGTPLVLHDEEAWVGTQALFEACGFERIAGEAAYPVMRKML